MVTFRHQKPAGSSFHEYTRQVPGRVGSLLAWIMRKCGTKLCHILQQVSLYWVPCRAPRSPPREGQNSVTREKLRGEAPMRCLPRPFTSAVLPRRGCGPAPRPGRGASSLPAASRCGCAASLGSISTSVAGRPPSSFEWEPAFGAMPHLSAVEPDRAGPTPATLPGCCLDFTYRLGGARLH